MIVAGCSNLQSFKINDGQDLIEIRNASVETNPVSNIFKELYIGRRLINNSNTSFINEDTGIEKVTFSQFATSVDDIGMDVAKDLKTVVSLGETPPTIADDFFSSDQYNNATLYIPQGAMQAYIEAPGWRYFYNVKELAYDFEYEGGYYNILSNKYLTCEITYKNKNRETEEYNGNFIIPETVKYDNDIYKVIGIGDGALSYCSNLVGVTIPKSITSIGSGSFEGCSSLHEITVDDENSNFTSIKGVLYSKDITKIYCCPAKLTETTFTIPETVKSIEPYAFYGCANLTSITIPESVTFIGDYAFARCTSLTNITIPTSVQSISAMIVDECNNLQSFKIDDGLALIDINVSNENKDSTPLNMFKELYIGRYLLNNSFKPFINKNTGLEKVTFGSSAFFVYYIGMDLADDLKTVISYGSVPPVIDDDFFSAYQYNNATLNIPEGTLQEYKEATGWRNFYNIVESLPTGISNVESTSGMTITADNGNIVISNAHGQVNVYDVSGVLINSAIADGTDLRITVPDHGIYIVKAGGKTQKVTM